MLLFDDALQVYSGKTCLTSSQVNQIFSDSLSKATSEARGAVSGFSGLCTCVQNVMVDMAFNLGEAGLSSFNTFLSYINNHEWSSAASDLKGTLWCRQVGNRCTRDSSIIAAGC